VARRILKLQALHQEQQQVIIDAVGLAGDCGIRALIQAASVGQVAALDIKPLRRV